MKDYVYTYKTANVTNIARPEFSMGRLDQARTRKCKPEPKNNSKL